MFYGWSAELFAFLRAHLQLEVESESYDPVPDLVSSPKSDYDHYNYFVPPKKKRLRIDAFFLPQNATYNPVNHRTYGGVRGAPR